MNVSYSRRQILAAVASSALAFSGALPAFATEAVTLETLPAAAGALTVQATDGAETTYDTTTLEALGARRMITTTDWHGENAAFDGVLLSDLLARHDLMDVPAIRVVVENDYAVTFTAEAIAEAPILVSTRVNGKNLGRRTRGPFFFAIDADDLARGDHLAERHSVWFATLIRAAAADEM